jgi:hypothetical protein
VKVLNSYHSVLRNETALQSSNAQVCTQIVANSSPRDLFWGRSRITVLGVYPGEEAGLRSSGSILGKKQDYGPRGLFWGRSRITVLGVYSGEEAGLRTDKQRHIPSVLCSSPLLVWFVADNNGFQGAKVT